MHKAQVQWREAVHAARGSEASAGWFARLRDRAVCRAAEIDRRTADALVAAPLHGGDAGASFRSRRRARRPDCARSLLTAARKHHGTWLAIDAALFAVSGVFMLVPGPNVLAYYFAFRVVGHYLSWRGARQALERITWSIFTPNRRWRSSASWPRFRATRARRASRRSPTA